MVALGTAEEANQVDQLPGLKLRGLPRCVGHSVEAVRGHHGVRQIQCRTSLVCEPLQGCMHRRCRCGPPLTDTVQVSGQLERLRGVRRPLPLLTKLHPPLEAADQSAKPLGRQSLGPVEHSLTDLCATQRVSQEGSVDAQLLQVQNVVDQQVEKEVQLSLLGYIRFGAGRCRTRPRHHSGSGRACPKAHQGLHSAAASGRFTASTALSSTRGVHRLPLGYYELNCVLLCLTGQPMNPSISARHIHAKVGIHTCPHHGMQGIHEQVHIGVQPYYICRRLHSFSAQACKEGEGEIQQDVHHLRRHTGRHLFGRARRHGG